MDKELKGRCDGWDILNNRSGGAGIDDRRGTEGQISLSCEASLKSLVFLLEVAKLGVK